MPVEPTVLLAACSPLFFVGLVKHGTIELYVLGEIWSFIWHHKGEIDTYLARQCVMYS